MNRKFLKYTVFVFILIILSVSVSNRGSLVFGTVNENIPVRVGIKYGNSTLNEVFLTSPSGIEALIKKSDGTYISIISSASPGSFNIWKDEHNNVNNEVWHVVTILYYLSYSEASDTALLLKQAGFEAWPVFMGGWKVISGVFENKDAALEESNNILLKTGNVQTMPFESKVPLQDGSATSLLAVGDRNRNILFFYAADSTLNSTDPLYTCLQFKPKSHENNSELPPLITVDNDQRYRGVIEISRRLGSDLQIVNELSMDEYLFGVVPPEIGASSPKEAIKAQAVVARTYAMHQIHSGKHSKFGFDLCSTVDCQSYKGYNSEGASCSGYIKETSGEIITYTYLSGPRTGQKELAQVFYFSTSGGITENCENVWSATLPYLVSVEDPYESTGLKYSNWSVTKSTGEISDYTGGALGKIIGLNILKLTQSGRVLELEVKGQSNDGTINTKVYSKEKARTVFNLYSQLYRIESDSTVSIQTGTGEQSIVQRDITGVNAVISGGAVQKTLSEPGSYNSVIGSGGVVQKIPSAPENYTFIGKGWGHGVGMSQNGAIGMANAGKTYREIITHYFTGVAIE